MCSRIHFVRSLLYRCRPASGRVGSSGGRWEVGRSFQFCGLQVSLLEGSVALHRRVVDGTGCAIDLVLLLVAAFSPFFFFGFPCLVSITQGCVVNLW